MYAPFDDQVRGGLQILGYGAAGGLTGGAYGTQQALETTGMESNPFKMWPFQGKFSDLWGHKKKRQHVGDFEQPSYQGYMYTPEEGFPEYYNPSGESINQTQQELYSQQPDYSGDLGLAMPQTTGMDSYDYNYTGGGNNFQQNYVGQQDYNYGSMYDDNSLYNTFQPSAAL